ncbi:DUF998 domain-containing protein [Plantactinospora soyae]|uniref:Membrane protein n=1 Tax=Plantactinospora soyae TaxID=1544732 RepID=A0A927R3W1_9ACTN|nr:DUF998 domain-containing protein [Plantactinospora soyae]MBE1484426.1 putative membrane protein [Plantactinospora soyae]
MSTHRLTRTLLGCGAVAPGLFILVFLVDGATRAGYDPTYHPVSALSLGPRGWIQITNFVLTGLLLLGFAVGLRRALHPGRASRWGPLMISGYGLSLLLSGTFVMDPTRGYPPGTTGDSSAGTSWHGVLHDNLGIVVFLSVPIACFILARRSVTRPYGHAWAGYDILTGIAGLALLVAFGSAWETDHPSTGLIQRVMIAVDWTWITLLALRLLAEIPPPQSPAVGGGADGLAGPDPARPSAL